MAKWKIEIGQLPRGARSMIVDYRKRDSHHRTYTRLAEVASGTTVVNLVEEGWYYFRVRLRHDKSGAIAPHERQELVYTKIKQAAADRTPIANIVRGSDQVTYNGATIEVQVGKVKDEPDEDYEYEVLVSKFANGKEDSFSAGIVKSGETVKFNKLAGEDEHTVHTQAQRADGEKTAFVTTNILTPDPPDHVSVEDHTGTTLVQGNVASVYGYQPATAGTAPGLESDPLPSIWNTANTDSIWGMDDSEVSIWAMDQHFPIFTYTTGELGETAVHNFIPLVHAEPGAHTMPARSIWGMMSGSIFNPEFRYRTPVRDLPFGVNKDPFYDQRHLCMWNTTAIDQGPLIVKKEISVSQDGLAFDPFSTIIDGKTYRAMKYKIRYTFYDRYQFRRIKVTKLLVRRLIKNKKFEFKPDFVYPVTSGLFEYTFAPVPEIVGNLVVKWGVEDVQSPAAPNEHYVTKLEELTATGVKIRVRKVDTTGPTWSTPAITDLKMHLILTGY